jgi:hypothetical protein
MFGITLNKGVLAFLLGALSLYIAVRIIRFGWAKPGTF